MASPSEARNFYKVLEVPYTADRATILASYKRLARLLHPDKNLGLDTTADFQLLQSAYSTLEDDIARKEYDREHGFARRAHSEPRTSKGASPTTSQARRHHSPTRTHEWLESGKELLILLERLYENEVAAQTVLFQAWADYQAQRVRLDSFWENALREEAEKNRSNKLGSVLLVLERSLPSVLKTSEQKHREDERLLRPRRMVDEHHRIADRLGWTVIWVQVRLRELAKASAEVDRMEQRLLQREEKTGRKVRRSESLEKIMNEVSREDVEKLRREFRNASAPTAEQKEARKALLADWKARMGVPTAKDTEAPVTVQCVHQ